MILVATPVRGVIVGAFRIWYVDTYVKNINLSNFLQKNSCIAFNVLYNGSCVLRKYLFRNEHDLSFIVVCW